MFTKGDAVIVVDYQNDFLPGGALGVNGGDKIVVAINRLIQSSPFAVATRDWHPEDHCSFGDPPEFRDGSWPKHCVADTEGAQISEKLDGRYIKKIFDKGNNKDKEAYSGFEDTDLAEYLKQEGIERVFICGLATDYCVKATAIDALAKGFSTVVVLDAVEAVNVPEGTGQNALNAMHEAGIAFDNSLDVISHD
jgi:nicotinamidase-related amidase